jgi:hypothetical protein
MYGILDRNNMEILADQIVTNTKFDETAFFHSYTYTVYQLQLKVFYEQEGSGY